MSVRGVINFYLEILISYQSLKGNENEKAYNTLFSLIKFSKGCFTYQTKNFSLVFVFFFSSIY